jgi:putative FmdB family regulatory protein
MRLLKNLNQEANLMPIYEFRCLACNQCFEILIMKKDETIETQCPKCGSEDFERVLSKTCYAMGSGEGKQAGVSAQSRSCSAGSCTTWDIPGHTR